MPDTTPIERADVAVAKAVAPIRDTPPVRALSWLSDIGDQPQMRILCGAVIAIGLARRDSRLALAGVRMIVAHSLATGIKSAIKHRVDRTRPKLLVERGDYEMGAGDDHGHDRSSFPSGHTAGAVAVASAFAAVYPEYRAQAHGAAAGVALMQIPRCEHYPTDVGAGAVIGFASAAAVGAASDAVLGVSRR